MNEYLEDVKDKLTSTPLFAGGKSNNQPTLKVPSVKFQGSAFVSTVAATPPVTTPIFVSSASTTPAAQSFVSRNLPIKEEDHREEYGVPTDTKLSCNNKEEGTYTFEGDPSCVESARPDQVYLDIQRKQAELSQMIVTQRARSLLLSHEPPTFSGDVMSYPAFIVTFETLIESKVDNSSERMYFLDQYTRGKAKELIKGCLQIKSGGPYEEARRLLKKHLSAIYKIAGAYIAKQSSWPAVRPNDGPGLQEFSIALEHARNGRSGTFCACYGKNCRNTLAVNERRK